MEAVRGRLPGILVAVAHGVFSGSLNILLKFLISSLHFRFLTLLQLCTCSAAAIGLEILRRLGRVSVPPFSLSLSKEFAPVCILSTLQSTLTLWSLRGLSLPMNGIPSLGVLTAVAITTGGAALAGAGDLSGDPFGYVTGVLAVIIHASYLVLIQKTSLDSQHGPLTAQYAIAVMATPVLLVGAVVSSDAVAMWSYPGWNDARVVTLFLSSVAIGCAMNFTTYHCTYLNSAVTTSFVGVVKSIVTITVGMVAFDDVAPTALFVGGVVVNTVGSVTYCVVKFFEIRKKGSYEHLEGGTKDTAVPPGEPERHKASLGGDAHPVEAGVNRGAGEAGVDPGAGEAGVDRGAGAVASRLMMEKNAVQMRGERLHKEVVGAASGQAAGNYVGVWRSIRQMHVTKDDGLIENMEQQSP
ncbi:solute carrier family 35 member D3 isoform X2 [Syngnathus scovelli]|uniref:solute carrier family 35 member D3 isoform X2 n=1 Tax=Syngnathus scovelli TaxID=161590 RepID=UPI0021109C1D|nr:solute carrier family 35 member D3 isoform X2 [Syngnathus scovelli]